MLECNSPVSAHGGAIQSPFNRAGPRERRGFQHAGVPESLRLQEGAAHGAGKRLSRLVELRLWKTALLPRCSPGDFKPTAQAE